MTKTTCTPVSAKDFALAYAQAKTKPARAKIREQVAAKAETNKRVRWTRLLADIDAGDVTRIEARGTGDWKAVNATRVAAEAKPKAKAKAKAKAPANNAMDDLVASLADVDDIALAAFFNKLAKARS